MSIENSAYGRSFIDLLNTERPADALVIFSDADRKYAQLLPDYEDKADKIRMHLTDSILPMAAIYLTLKERYPEDALDIMYRIAKPVSSAKGKRYRAVTEKQDGKKEFLSMLGEMVKDSFGPDAGFGLDFLEEGEKKVSFDITSCPYFRFCTELGCPELTPVFCKNDDYSYGDLEGIEFTRTSTIGNGGAVCDFRFEDKEY